MKAKLALLAKSIILSHDTQVPSAIGIMENFYSEGLPFVIPEIAFLTVWQSEEGDPKENEGLLTVTIDDEEILKHEVSLSFGLRKFARRGA